MKMIKLRLLVGLSLGLKLTTYAQATRPTNADSLNQAAALAVVRLAYEQHVKAESRLLSGTEYVNLIRPGSQGSQFFDSPIAQPATIKYDGQLFTAVPLLYDIQRDQAVLQLPDRDLRIQLLAEKVQSFRLGKHYFVRHVATDTLATQSLRTGFYELLLDGSTQGVSLLAHYTKREVQEPSGGHLTFVLEEKRHLYLQKGNAYWEVNNLRDLQRLLPEHKDDLQKFARSQHLRFKNNTQDAAATALLRYYNTLL